MSNTIGYIDKKIKDTKERIRSLQIKLVKLKAEKEIRYIEGRNYQDNYLNRKKKNGR